MAFFFWAGGIVGVPVYAQQDTTHAEPSSATQTQVLRDVGVQRDTIQAFQPQPYTVSRPVLPGTEHVRLGRTVLDTAAYRFDDSGTLLRLDDRFQPGPTDTLFVTYRTFPFSLDPVFRRRAPDSTQVDTASRMQVVEEVVRDTSRAFDPFEGVTLQRSGTISRGVVGGTNRDATIESGLRMQLNGELAEDVFVRATLTDQNTPIQPDGTTQRLNDFDRVFIEIEAPQGTAQLGDVDVDFSGSRYGRFSRRLQGASVSSDTIGPALGLPLGRANVVGAVSRGIFQTQDIQPIDGVQGPYRLSGRDGETLIVIIAGSERVYLDGERLERGRTNDYVIDYARGELRFTPNRLITDDRRITVEFQYRTGQFTRTFLGATGEAGAWTGDDGRARLRVGATVLREADGDDFQSAFDLTAQDSLRLVESGDEPARRDGAERVEFDPEAPFIQYTRERVETPDGDVDTAFVALDAAPPEGTFVFRVRFSNVGSGQGRYVRAGREANGILYEYRGPGRGSYEPVLPLPKPQRRQLVDVTASLEPIRGLRVYGEWAQSENDQNRFSELDADDDIDAANLVGAELTPVPFEVGDTSLGTITARVEREERGRNFTTFDVTRPIEFSRIWNLAPAGPGTTPLLQNAGDETTLSANATWAVTSTTSLDGEAGQLAIGEVFEAQRRMVRGQVDEPGLPRLDVRSELVTSTSRPDRIDGRWLRQRGVLRVPLANRRVEPRIEVDHERRAQRRLGTDSLTASSFSFLEIRPGVRFAGDALSAGTSVEYRTEGGPAAGRFRSAATAWTVQSEVDWTPGPTYEVRGKGGYRVRTVEPFFRRTQGRENTEALLVQVDAGARPLDRALDVRLFYDAQTERTPTLQEVYVRTGPEIGQFVWEDVNEDGLQQVDEFIPETTPNEGTYVQSFVPSDSLESVVNVQARLRLQLDPAQRLRRGGVVRSVARSVTTRTTLEVTEQSRSDALADLYLLNLRRYRQPETTIDGEFRVEQDVELFRRSSRGGVTTTWTQVRGLSERAAGTEARFANRWASRIRFQPSRDWSTALTGSVERDRSASDAFQDTRGFSIRTLQGAPEVAYRASRRVTVSTQPSWARKTDNVQGRTAQVVKVPVDVEWRRAGRFRLRANGEVAQVDLDGAARGLARFELTDGRGPGRSYLWGLQGNYVLNQYLRATLSYDGRAPSGADVIHTFRVQVSASF